MAEFKHALEKWLLDIYAQQIHRGIGTTPWAKWHEGLQRKTLTLPTSLESLQQRIGKVLQRKLRHDGLWILGIRYASDDLVPILRRWGEGIPVRIVYDSEDLGQIQVWPPEDEHPITIPAVHLEYAKGLTELQHNHLRQILRDEGKKAEDLPALMAARQQFAASINKLMTSRNQRPKRRAGQMHGITSEQPSRRFSEPSTPAETDTPPIQTVITSTESPKKAPYGFFSTGGMQ